MLHRCSITWHCLHDRVSFVWLPLYSSCFHWTHQKVHRWPYITGTMLFSNIVLSSACSTTVDPSVSQSLGESCQWRASTQLGGTHLCGCKANSHCVLIQAHHSLLQNDTWPWHYVVICNNICWANLHGKMSYNDIICPIGTMTGSFAQYFVVPCSALVLRWKQALQCSIRAWVQTFLFTEAGEFISVPDSRCVHMREFIINTARCWCTGLKKLIVPQVLLLSQINSQ